MIDAGSADQQIVAPIPVRVAGETHACAEPVRSRPVAGAAENPVNAKRILRDVRKRKEAVRAGIGRAAIKQDGGPATVAVALEPQEEIVHAVSVDIAVKRHCRVERLETVEVDHISGFLGQTVEKYRHHVTPFLASPVTGTVVVRGEASSAMGTFALFYTTRTPLGQALWSNSTVPDREGVVRAKTDQTEAV